MLWFPAPLQNDQKQPGNVFPTVIYAGIRVLWNTLH